MGIHPAPSYANIFMAKIDDQIVKLANTYKITEDLEKISGWLFWNLDRFYWEILSIPGWYQ